MSRTPSVDQGLRQQRQETWTRSLDPRKRSMEQSSQQVCVVRTLCDEFRHKVVQLHQCFRVPIFSDPCRNQNKWDTRGQGCFDGLVVKDVTKCSKNIAIHHEYQNLPFCCLFHHPSEHPHNIVRLSTRDVTVWRAQSRLLSLSCQCLGVETIDRQQQGNAGENCAS